MFGNEWSYQPGYVDSAAPAPESTPSIPYYLQRPEGLDYDAAGVVGTESATPQAEGRATSPAEWFGMGKEVVGTFVDIFGRSVNPPGQYPAMPPPSSGVPLWGWALIGIGAVAAVGWTIRSLKTPQRRYAGRRRR